MYDESDDDAWLGPEGLLSLHFDDDWEMEYGDAMERDEPMARALPSSLLGESDDESAVDLACAEELRKLHRMLFMS